MDDEQRRDEMFRALFLPVPCSIRLLSLPAWPSMSSTEHQVLVWDPSTRLFHWLAAVLVAATYVTWRLDLMDWHARTGDAVLTLVIFRLLWGCFGSDTARFSHFLASPQAVLRHLARLTRREPDQLAGHNPAGGYMVLVLLVLLVGETLSGLYVQNDIADQGPLTELVPTAVANAISDVHWIFWDALLAAVALHVLAIAIYAAVKGQNLLTPMITGRKTLPSAVPQPGLASALRAAVLFSCSVLATAVLANFL
jgi:cytochrome b